MEWFKQNELISRTGGNRIEQINYWRVMRYWIAHAKDVMGLSTQTPKPIALHLAAAVDWILRAQRGTPDDGVAHSYDIKKRAWIASYPETTGYIIPTLYDYAKYFDAPHCREAALRMAHWEVDEQLEDGGVRAGTMAAEVVVPTIFNTGQVLFGLARAAAESGDPRLVDALRKAADWLVDAQDEDGRWRRFPSPFAHSANGTYNTRSAFGLVRAFEVVGDRRYLDAATKNVAWAMSTALPNGWLPGNCLSLNVGDSALTHTVAYAMRGILELGVASNTPRFVDHALLMGLELAAKQNSNGSLSGYISPRWEPLSRWTCITGNSQMAINWLRLAKVTGENAFVENARAANRFNMSIQNLEGADETRGALKGSHPIGEEYMTWRYPNWAAKFFVDALMFEHLYSKLDNIG